MQRKLLFDRLQSTTGWSDKDAIEESLNCLTVNQYVRDPLAPPGILNFGLPMVVDHSHGDASMHRYAALIEARIAEFEPRLSDVQVKVQDGVVQVAGRSGGEDIQRWWLR